MRDPEPAVRGPFESEIFEGVVVIALPNVLSAVNRDHVPAAVLHYIRAELCHFVVDCSACQQLAPSAIGMLAEMRDIVRAHRGEMLLAGVGPAVQREILRAGMGAAFAVCWSAAKPWRRSATGAIPRAWRLLRARPTRPETPPAANARGGSRAGAPLCFVVVHRSGNPPDPPVVKGGQGGFPGALSRADPGSDRCA